MAATSGTTTPTAQAPNAAPSTSAPAKKSSGSRSAPPPSSSGQRITGDDIFSAVDGEGQSPKFGAEEITGKKASAAEKPGSRKAGDKPGEGAVLRAREAESVTAETTSPSYADLEAAFQRDLTPPDAGEVSTETTEELGDDTSKEAGRLKTLADRTKAAEAKAQAAEAASLRAQQAAQQSVEQVGQYLANVMQQNTKLQTQVEMLMRGQRQEELDPAEKIERDLISKSVSEARGRMNPEIQALRQEVEGLKQARIQDQRLAETNTNKARYLGESQSAARDIVLKGLSDEDAQTLMPDAVEDILATAWGKRTNAVQAAKIVRERYIRYGLAFVRAQAKAGKPKTNSAEAPKPPPVQRASAGGEPEPSFEQLHAGGYRGPNALLDWMFDGRPPLSR